MRQRELLTALLASVTMCVSLAALGSGPRWAACMAAFLALATAIPQIPSRRQGRRLSPLLLLFVTAAVLTALQLIPLPQSVIAALTPIKLSTVLDNATALDEQPPGTLPLSYDPPATALELAKLAGYAAFAFACMRLTTSSRGRRWLVVTVALSGVALAICGVAHNLLGLKALFGLYQPASTPPPYLAPLINENHMAGYLALSAPLCLTLGILAAERVRFLWLGGAILCAGVAMLSESRGAFIALMVGMLVTAGLLVLQRRRQPTSAETRKTPLSVTVPAGIIAACAVVVLVFVTAEGVQEELADTSMQELDSPDSKVGVWRAATELVADNPWTGVGRGGFEYAFTRVHHSGVKTYSHVENEYLQAIVDWGVPAAAILLGLIIWTVLVGIRRWQRSPLEASALGALAAVGAHSVVDFHVELAGVALTVIALAAVVMPASLGKAKSKQRQIVLRSAGTAVALACIALASSPFGNTAASDSDELAALLTRARIAPPVDREATAERAARRGHALMHRHPSDYLMAGLTAQAYFYKRDPRALKLMNRALSLNPKHAGLHVLTAKMLVAGDKDSQALIEFALALRYTLEPQVILTDLVRLFPDPEQAAQGIPTSVDRVPVMTNRLMTLERPEIAYAYARRALADNPGDIGTMAIVARLALDYGDGKVAVAAAEPVYRKRGQAEDALIYGQALAKAEQFEEALVVLDQAVNVGAAYRLSERRIAQGYELIATIHKKLGRHVEARAAIHRGVRYAGDDRGMQARLARLIKELDEELENSKSAPRAPKPAPAPAAPQPKPAP